MQEIVIGNGTVNNLKSLLSGRRFLLVHSPSLSRFTEINAEISSSSLIVADFGEVKPNPDYETVQKALELFVKNDCNAILAIGGGSVIDVAKAIKYYYDNSGRNDIYLIAVPTTAGTGSESTSFAVIYINGEKKSLSDSNLLPDVAYLEGSLLNSLPLYQKKCTLLDAMCQCIESLWSVNSTAQSMEYAQKGIQLIRENYEKYFSDDNTVNSKILLASNYSGRAICISKTTAAHAMSYKITSKYGIPHGHAVAICLPYVWEFIVQNIDSCVDARGKEYLIGQLDIISDALGYHSCMEAIDAFKHFLMKIDIHAPAEISNEEIEALTEAVNLERLKNTPVKMDKKDIRHLYSLVFSKK